MKKRRLRYLGPGHVLVLNSGERVMRGDEIELRGPEAEHLIASPHVWVDVLAPAKAEPEAESGAGQADEPKE
jgi:hypothetical protein